MKQTFESYKTKFLSLDFEKINQLHCEMIHQINADEENYE